MMVVRVLNFPQRAFSNHTLDIRISRTYSLLIGVSLFKLGILQTL